MFGNGLGWTISAAIVGLAALLLFVIGKQGEVTPMGAVGRDAANYTVRMPIEPMALKRSGLLTESSSAEALYQQAIKLFEQDQYALEHYDQMMATHSAEAQRWETIMGLLQKGAASARPGVFAGAMGQVINYEPEKAALEALRTIGRAAVRLGLLANAEGNPQASRRYTEAAFALGAQLYYERLTYAELDVAQDLMGQSAPTLAKLAEKAGETEYATLVTDFNRQRIEYWKSRILPVQQAVQILEANVGNLLALAERGGDAMWRVEAVLALGRSKYSAARGADQRAALRSLEVLSQDADPRIRMAAAAGRELTIVQYRKLR